MSIVQFGKIITITPVLPIGLFVSSREVGSIAPIGVVMLPEALAFEA